MSLRSITKQFLPRSVRQAARSFFWSAGDVRYRWKTGERGFPPAYLRVKVCGSIPVESYLIGQEPTTQAVLMALGRVGAMPTQFKNVLDFGCGCGRILIPMQKHLPQAQFYETDTEEDLIRWSRTHIPQAKFSQNGPEPPLPYADATFDLIYGLSVFTHLDERLQFLWLEELRRVAQPGAILVLTVHGMTDLAVTNPEGFQFVKSEAWSDFFPDFYHTTYHSRAYVEKQWGRFFTVLDYDNKTLGQDIVVLRRAS